MGKIKTTLKTVSRSGVPNPNGYTYSKVAFRAMVAEVRPRMEWGGIYLSRRGYCMLNIDPMNAMKFMTVFSEDILGTVTDIRDGEVDVEIDPNKFDEFNRYISEGYVPGMRYIANIDGGRVTNMKLICFDMIKLPERLRNHE